jgi:hypothetical protein
VCAAGFLVGALGYVGFTKLRDREINTQLDAKIDKHLAECRDLSNGTIVFKAPISVWGKHCDFIITVQVSSSVGPVRIGHVRAVCDNKVVRAMNLSS